MPTDLPERSNPRPTNPGTEKMPEDPIETQRKKIIENTRDSDIPDPAPDLGGPGLVPAVI